MRPILSAEEFQRASEPLKRAVLALDAAARQLPALESIAEPGAVRQGNMVHVPNPRFDPLLNPPGSAAEAAAYQSQNVQNYAQPRRETWIQGMQNFIRNNYPRATPTDDAVREVSSWLDRAMACGYPVYDAGVRNKLCAVILQERTSGYIDSDTTGTQMGNFQGEWRGGGFS